jgi:uncharacterized protein involved in outer membrane biogenesis
MNNGLLFLGGLLALVLGALFGVPYAVDWNGYRGVFEEEASKVLGRDVRVGGDVAVRFLPTPFVRFEKVRLADTTGQTGEPFVRAESFTMRLAISPLLRGEFEATDIELMKPMLSLVPDAEGGGNWASLELKPGALPFVPQNVMLHAVRLVDGTISVHRPDGGDMTRIDSINGELSAETLKGPFKFKGTGVVAGTARDIKFATMAPEPSGAVRFKGAMHAEAGKNSYLFDGQIEDLSTKPRVTGELTGKIHVNAPLASGGTATAAAPLAVFELKTQVKGDARGATFEGVELALDGAAEPQIVTGQASAQWSQINRMDAALAAKWLDLDVLAAPQGEQSSIPGLKQLFINLMAGMGGGDAAAVRLDVEQVKFGGERAGALHLDAERRGEAITIRRLKSGLPGGARFELAGELTRDRNGKSPEFTGEGTVRGVNFDRVKAFAQRSGIPVDVKAESPFWIAGKVAISDSRVAISRAKADIGGLAVSGDLEITRGERPGLALRLEGDRIDSAVFFPEASGRVHAAVRKAAGVNGQLVEAAAGAASGAVAGPTNASFRILARELRHAGRVYNDVDTAASVDNGVLSIANASFKLPSGAQVKVSGRVEGVEDPQRPSKGGLSYEFDAANTAAISEAAQLFGLADAVGTDGLDTLPSLQIAGLVKIGQRLPAATDVTFDGLAGSVRIAGDAGFDNGFASWRSAPVRFVGSARGSDLSAILALTGTRASALEGLRTRPGEGKIAVSGVLRQGAKTYAGLAADGLSASLSGTVTLGKDDTFLHAASGQLKAADAREAAALAGFAAPAGLAAASVEGPLQVTASGRVLTLSTAGLKAGSSRISGDLKVTSADASKPRRVEGSLDADRVSVAGLLSWLTGMEPQAAAGSEEEHAGVWPQGGFKLTALDGLEGAFKLRAKTFELADDLSASDASAELKFAPGSLQVSALKGQAAGGTVSGEGRVEGRPAGVMVSAKLALEGDLAALHPKATGRAALSLEGSGLGANPAGAMAAFNGKGSIKLADARHPGPSAAFVADAADAVLAGKMASDPATLTPALTSGLEEAVVEPGARTVAFTIAGGAVKAEPYAMGDSHGRTVVTNTVSLALLALDSSWQVTATPSPLPAPVGALPDWKATPKGPLPAVSFVYTGRLSALDKVEAAVAVEDVSRELTVRLMERKVEELEALRNADDFRRKQELERRKALELERQQAAAAAAAAARAQAAAERAQAAAARAAAAEKAAAERAAAEQAKKVEPTAAEPEPEVASPEAAPPTTGTVDSDAEQAGLAGDAVDGEAPAAGAPPVTRAVQPSSGTRASTPKPRPPRRSTTSDEVNRAFGGWP